nr:helix-turn-helix transcriptional regulator [uncultured Chryseobacterium sp.]
MEHYKTLTELHLGNSWNTPENSLFSIVDCNSICSLTHKEFTADCYVIAFKKIKSGVFMYGRTPYDHDNGCLFFTKPRQIIEIKEVKFEEKGYMLFIHEDYLNGNELFKQIEEYGFFEYDVIEALHLSAHEEQIILDLLHKIQGEHFNNSDEYSQEIILSYISSILKNSQRFYKRQFMERQQAASKTVSKFNHILREYMNSDKLQSEGLPNVKKIAEQFIVSPRYLSDALKYETGKTALEHIHIFLISEAKNLLILGEKGISEIAYELGFENTSYFTRLFKKHTGMKPFEFKRQRLN